MKITKEQAIEALKRRGVYNPPPPQKTKEPSFSRYLGIGARGVAQGIGAIPDLLALPSNIALTAQGADPLPSFSENIGKGFDYLTDNQYKPESVGEKALGTSSEFISGGGGIAKAGATIGSKFAKKFLAPEKARDYLALGAAGAGLEGGRELAPESTLIPIATSLGASILPGGAHEAFKGLQKTYNLSSGLTPKGNALKQLQSINPNEALMAKEAGERLGVQLRPSEASGNPFVAAKEGGLGKTASGAEKMHRFGEKRVSQEVSSINSLYDDIDNSGSLQKSPDQRIRDAAKAVIKNEKKVLQEKAAPFYEGAYKKKLGTKELKNILSEEPIIQTALKDVLKKDTYKSEVKKYGKNSVHTLDLVKKNLDDKIKAAQRQGLNNEVRLITQAKNKLTESLDILSPGYKTGRSIYSKELPAIVDLENSPLGKIAKRKDLTIKNIGKDIFDKQQTNPEILKNIRDKIYKQDPNAWNAIVRQEMNRLAGSSNKGGSKFFRKVLEDDTTFNNFKEALSNNSQAQKKLEDMRIAFKNIINPITAKTAAGQAKSSLDAPRSTAEFIKNISDKIIGGAYDNAAIDLILDSKWDSQLKAANKLKPEFEKLNAIGSLLSSISKETRENKNNKTEEKSKGSSALSKPSLTREQAIEALKRRGKYNPSQQNNSFSDVIKSSASENGLNPEFVHKVAKVESNLNPNAKNPNSSASGLFQFTNGTWRHLVNQYGKDLDISLRDKNNPIANTKMASLYLRDNARKLTRILDREPTQGEVYASHVLGLGGANKLIKNYGKGKIASAIFPKEARVNKEIFYKNGKPVSIEQLYNFFSKKMSA